MGSIVHRSVPTNLKWFPTCSHAHAMFQDRFKDVQVGSRWFSTLYILSPNFHRRSVPMRKFPLPNLVCSSQVSCATHRRTDGYVVTGVAATLVRLRMSPNAISKQPTAGTLSWRFIIRMAPGEDPRQICCHGSSWTNASLRWRLRALVIPSLSSGPFSPLPGLVLWGHHEDRSWTGLYCWKFGPVVPSHAWIVVAVKLTFAPKRWPRLRLWRVTFGGSSLQIEGFCGLVHWWGPPVALYAAFRLHTSSRFRWVSWSFLA